MNEDFVGWLILALAPILALFTAMGLYNAIRTSRQKEWFVGGGVRHDEEYRLWRESLRIRGRLASVFCPLLAAAGETCYFYACQANFCVPSGFQEGFGSEMGPHVEFSDRVSLYVSNLHVGIKGARVDLEIPLSAVQVVSADFEHILIGAESLDHLVLVYDVCGCQIRDILHFLRGSAVGRVKAC